VLESFREGWITPARVAAYGVVLDERGNSLAVDREKTASLRASMEKAQHGI